MQPRTVPPTQDAPDSDAIRSFYDAFTQKLVRDYIEGNVRQSRAFELVRSAIGADTRTILDVGCGIGASSASYVEGTTGVSVHGVDISPNNIRVATALFGGPRVRFSVSDMTSPPGEDRYDLIALVDMHEHIPRASWPASSICSFPAPAGPAVGAFRRSGPSWPTTVSASRPTPTLTSPPPDPPCPPPPGSRRCKATKLCWSSSTTCSPPS